VLVEPVSAAKFLVSGKNTGNFTKMSPGRDRAEIQRRFQSIAGKFRMQANREFFAGMQDRFQTSREVKDEQGSGLWSAFYGHRLYPEGYLRPMQDGFAVDKFDDASLDCRR
jgi:hypothetical protein